MHDGTASGRSIPTHLVRILAEEVFHVDGGVSQHPIMPSRRSLVSTVFLTAVLQKLNIRIPHRFESTACLQALQRRKQRLCGMAEYKRTCVNGDHDAAHLLQPPRGL